MPDDGRWDRNDATLAALGAQMTALAKAVAAVQQRQDAEVAADQQQLAKVEARFEAEAQRDRTRDEEWERRYRLEAESLGAIYGQMVEVRKGVDGMQAAAQDAAARRRLELVPVRVGDLMRGFQSAVSRANRSARAGDGDGEDIEAMAIKDLAVSLQAPVIEGGHAEDPTLMLPNIKSVDRDTASVTLTFNVVTVPTTGRR